MQLHAKNFGIAVRPLIIPKNGLAFQPTDLSRIFTLRSSAKNRSSSNSYTSALAEGTLTRSVTDNYYPPTQVLP